MTQPTDTSREAVEAAINDLWERASPSEARQAEKYLRALLAHAEAAEAEVNRLNFSNASDKDARDNLQRLYTQVTAQRDALQAENARLREALVQIVQWSEAYPTEVFPEPDFARAAAALSSVSMSLDAVSASNMRHATKGVGAIARAALETKP